ncbi:hypothetical protein BHE90_009561 [Fusarium euwallaceae]|uniref:Uncharacterized protein n=1 Tax=Fusarium euwallaceae TaxID=1147111 RepID=A0A430LJW3_9HYPO|nr:hypothetical protein BHE90_009561 [Fusarium euwallaceae]
MSLLGIHQIYNVPSTGIRQRLNKRGDKRGRTLADCHILLALKHFLHIFLHSHLPTYLVLYIVPTFW